VSTLLVEQAGLNAGIVNVIAAINTEYAGYLLAALFAVIGISAWILWRRTAPASTSDRASARLRPAGGAGCPRR
jgi:high-affinity nickel permease